MSDRPDLAEALARAQARAAALIDTPAPPAPEAAIIAMLRAAALVYGLVPDDVERSFVKGGPLAELVRAVLGAEARPPAQLRGRPPKLAETWITFVNVVLLIRSGLTQEEAIGRVAVDSKTAEATVRDRFTRTRDRDGVSPESVPSSRISALFADPRSARRTAKR